MANPAKHVYCESYTLLELRQDRNQSIDYRGHLTDSYAVEERPTYVVHSGAGLVSEARHGMHADQGAEKRLQALNLQQERQLPTK